MFARRNKNDGFEWHKYVRTTIKLKREARRQKVRDAGRAAGEQAGAAGSALLAGSKAAGAAAWGGARLLGNSAWLLLLGAWNVLVVAALVTADKLGALLLALGDLVRRLSRPVLALLARPVVAAGLALALALAAGAVLARTHAIGFDREAMWTLVLAGVLLALLLPTLAARTGLSLPRLPRLPLSPRALGATVAGLALVVAGALGLRHLPGGFDLGRLSAGLPLVGGTPPLAGRAVAVGGDRLRIGGTTVRLAGIELPEINQLCGRPGGRQFRCGGQSTNALARLVSGAQMTCTLEGQDDAGTPLARCVRGDKDIGAEMVRTGQAFAQAGLVSTRYGTQEQEARTAKAGVWAAGDTARPQEWRDKAWEEAKRKAPEGCPIKGVVAGGSKFYLVPWSPDYERGRVRANLGERWFCSEREAQAAGFKPRA